METITIVFSKSTAKIATFSRLIMASEKVPYSHVAVKMIDDETGQNVYYQASSVMVNEMGEDEFLSKEKIIYSFDFLVDSDLKKDMKKFCVSQLGKSYGLLTVVGLAIVQIGKWIGLKISNPFKDNGTTYVCDQFVATMVDSCTSTKIANIDSLGPVDLYPMVQSWPQQLTR